ncbi:hypothetical protein A4F85_04740 [Delftia sp. GW456-R20]|uniref:hypothetical protein n=1 Tax=Delftia sp. GW456-R20 TaxID=1827145 RepID=UPI0007AE8A5A|nr:hypothetical protein [Delftia sp. GW456-R20]KZK32025.1 hypothetical protein A4F85_04740 [Delftia sp. GW456-R20]
MRTIEEIKGRCVITEDGHWLWRGSVRPDGRPNIYAPDHTRQNGGMTTQAGPRAIWHITTGKAIPTTHRAYVVCPHPTCCNPECIRCTTERLRGQFARRIGRHKGTPKHIAANRAINVKRAKLTAEQVLYVQSSPKTGVALAAELGVSMTTVSKCRRGQNVVTAPGGAPNVFAGLMR